ncbi:MAG: hypothetical protein KAJ19_26105 [Gammaproteobacteria bacterium]|nr:hypothetical protein [Gammaproteobacteria bacterium]
MGDEKKHHQTSTRDYQIRVDGKTVRYEDSMSRYLLERYAEVCKENPGCYVDIVRVDIQIIMSQYEYREMRRHFEADDGPDEARA